MVINIYCYCWKLPLCYWLGGIMIVGIDEEPDWRSDRCWWIYYCDDDWLMWLVLVVNYWYCVILMLLLLLLTVGIGIVVIVGDGKLLLLFGRLIDDIDTIHLTNAWLITDMFDDVLLMMMMTWWWCFDCDDILLVSIHYRWWWWLLLVLLLTCWNWWWRCIIDCWWWWWLLLIGCYDIDPFDGRWYWWYHWYWWYCHYSYCVVTWCNACDGIAIIVEEAVLLLFCYSVIVDCDMMNCIIDVIDYYCGDIIIMPVPEKLLLLLIVVDVIVGLTLLILICNWCYCMIIVIDYMIHSCYWRDIDEGDVWYVGMWYYYC